MAEQQVQRKKTSGRRMLPVLALILAVAAFLRFAALGKLELWLDENCSVLMATAPQGVLRSVLNDTNPPLYLYLLKGWIALFGISAPAVRSLSAVLGVAQLAVLGAWLRRAGLGRRVALWAVALGALAPLHVYYSQEARAYPLAWLLVTLALWSFSAAVANGSWRRWLLHGGCVTLGLYTHNLFVFFIPVFWAAGALMRLGRRDWGRMAAAYLLVGILYLPWLACTLRTVQGGSLAWLAENWANAHAAGLIPASLEVLGTGNHVPEFARIGNLPPAARLFTLPWLAAILGGAALALRDGMKSGEAPNFPNRPGSVALLLGLAAFLPLALMLAVSMVSHPIYVVGRYDTLVFPPLLGLMGLGAARLQSALERRIRPGLAFALILFVPLAVAASLTVLKLKPFPPNELHAIQQARGEVLRDHARSGDLVVCLGLEGAKIAYQVLRLGIKVDLRTYPLETQTHMGYFLYRDAAARPDLLRRDAELILDQFANGKDARRRLWVMRDPYAFRQAAPGSMEDAHTRIALVLLDAIQERGLQQWREPEFMQRTDRLGIRVYEGAMGNGNNGR